MKKTKIEKYLNTRAPIPVVVVGLLFLRFIDIEVEL